MMETEEEARETATGRVIACNALDCYAPAALRRRAEGVRGMPTQVRIYTINRGMLDSWIKVFNEKIVPTSAKFGVHVIGAWVNRPQNEFVWVRTFESVEKLRVYEQSPERA